MLKREKYVVAVFVEAVYSVSFKSAIIIGVSRSQAGSQGGNVCCAHSWLCLLDVEDNEVYYIVPVVVPAMRPSQS